MKCYAKLYCTSTTHDDVVSGVQLWWNVFLLCLIIFLFFRFVHGEKETTRMPQWFSWMLQLRPRCFNRGASWWETPNSRTFIMINGTDGQFVSLRLFIKSKRVLHTEETGDLGDIWHFFMFNSWEIIFYFTAFSCHVFHIYLSVSKHKLWVNHMVQGCFDQISGGYSQPTGENVWKMVNVYKNIQKHWECTHISLYFTILCLVMHLTSL